jgi:hypothetical protein
MLHCTLALDVKVLILSFLFFLDGVSGMILTFVGENGSMHSFSGLVALPSNDVGRVVKVSSDEENEDSDAERCISHAPFL